jgi:cytochrome subunit of sulfide dehydrogenase
MLIPGYSDKTHKETWMRRLSFLAATTCMTTALLGLTNAQANELQVKLWAAACATCHGTNGHAVGANVRLAGADAKATLESLLAYKRGQRQGTIMHQIAKGYSDEQLAQISQYFAAQK